MAEQYGFSTATGFNSPTFGQLLARFGEYYDAETGVTLDRELETPTLALGRTIARMFKAAYDDQFGTYSSGYIGGSAGAALRNQLYPFIGAPLNDVASTVPLPLAGTPGTKVSAGSTVKLDADGAGAAAWTLQADVELPGTGLFRYAVPGPKSAPAGSTWSIATPVNGWSSAGPNVDDASKGRLAETDAEYRKRYALSITGTRIAAEVAKVPGVTAVTVFENPTDIPDLFWGATHWVEVLVQGGDNALIAQAIHRARGYSSVWTLGSVTVDVPDSNYASGSSRTRFSRPTETSVYTTLTITKGEGYSSDTSPAAIAAREDAIRSQIMAWSLLRRAGLDVTGFQIAVVAASTPSVPGIAEITALVDTVDPPVATIVSAQPRELLVFDPGRIKLVGV